MKLQTLEAATQAFLDFSPPSLKGSYKLDRMRQLMNYLGDPQEKVKIIHVAGTSGKTSTAYFIRNMLEAAGQRTGLTVSPHIVAINERVQIDGMPLEPARFLAYVNRFFELVSKTALQPTYFELLIALAFWVFVQEKVDYAVVETGLGGLLDGTNVVSRPDKLCVITDIGLDHTEILGETLAEIAAQKAGIIQPHNHVIVHQQTAEVMDVIVAAVQKQRAAITVVDGVQSGQNLPDFQQRNWALASAAFEYIKQRDNLTALTPVQFAEAARQTPPGRWEQYRYKDKLILLDGAHNPQKLQALCSSLESKGIHSAAVLANFAEAPTKKITDALAVLRPLATRLIIPDFKVGQDIKGRRSVPAEHLAEHARVLGFTQVEVCPDMREALQRLLKADDKTLLITGSLYLVSLLRPYVAELADRS